MRELSRIISVFFHPLLFPTYGTLFVVLANPNRFGYWGEKVHIVWLIIIFALTFIFPVIWLIMMYRLDMVSNFELETPKERIIPFIATGTFYLWAAWMFKPSVQMKIPANELVFFMMLGACISVFIGFLINIFSKVSLHAIAAGSIIGLALVMVRLSTYDLRLLLLVLLLLAGLIGTARLYLGAHNPRQVYTGYLVGFTAQFVAFSLLPKLF